MPSFGGGTPGNTPIAVKFGKSAETDHQFTGSVWISGSLYAQEYSVNSITQTITNIEASGSTKFGNSADDTHQFSGSLHIADDAKLYFGANQDASMEYDADSTNRLIINGPSAGLTLSPGSIYVGGSTIPSGSRAGENSYIALNTSNQLVLVEGGGGGAGTTINNATENEIVTVASTTSELDAEANLTFDGATLTSNAFGALSAYGNASTINTTVTMPANYNSILYGPITIGASGQFTIGSDSIVKIKDISDA